MPQAARRRSRVRRRGGAADQFIRDGRCAPPAATPPRHRCDAEEGLRRTREELSVAFEAGGERQQRRVRRRAEPGLGGEGLGVSEQCDHLRFGGSQLGGLEDGRRRLQPFLELADAAVDPLENQERPLQPPPRRQRGGTPSASPPPPPARSTRRPASQLARRARRAARRAAADAPPSPRSRRPAQRAPRPASEASRRPKTRRGP